MITTLAISGYRSLRDLQLPLGRLTVVTGPNGSGKSSLYRALRLLADVADGRVIGALAAEGGLASTLWAGPERIANSVRRGTHPVEGTVRRNAVALRLGFAGEDVGYAIDLGLPPPLRTTLFHFDPEIKAEALWLGPKLSPRTILAARNGPSARLRDAEGAWLPVPTMLQPFDSLMTHGADPRHGAELFALRERMRAWRFYDQFRTDREAPARRAQVGTRTPVLSADGADLAAAVQTILEIGDAAAFAATVADAFAGAAVTVTEADGLFALQMRQPGLLRPLVPAELSDGTLRFLLLATALLAPRAPELLVLNEPEASLHPALMAPLARLIALAAVRAQVVVVTHADSLMAELSRVVPGLVRLDLSKDTGETLVEGCDSPPWTWPSR